MSDYADFADLLKAGPFKRFEIVGLYHGRSRAALVRDLEDSTDWVAKVGTIAAMREEYRCYELAATSGVCVPKVFPVVLSRGFGILISEWLGDRRFGSYCDSWQSLGRSIASVHIALAPLREQLEFDSPDSWFEDVRPPEDDTIIGDIFDEQLERIASDPPPYAVVHGDFQLSNLRSVLSADRHALIDFGDVEWAPAVLDLGSLAWSCWASDVEIEFVWEALEGFRQTSGLDISRESVCHFALIAHFRWMKFLRTSEAPAGLQRNAEASLISFRQDAPRWLTM